MGLTNDSLIDTVFEKHQKKEIAEQGDEILSNWNLGLSRRRISKLQGRPFRSFCTKHND